MRRYSKNQTLELCKLRRWYSYPDKRSPGCEHKRQKLKKVVGTNQWKDRRLQEPQEKESGIGCGPLSFPPNAHHLPLPTQLYPTFWSLLDVMALQAFMVLQEYFMYFPVPPKICFQINLIILMVCVLTCFTKLLESKTLHCSPLDI